MGKQIKECEKKSKKQPLKLHISRKTGIVCLAALAFACFLSVGLNRKQTDDTIITYNIVSSSETDLETEIKKSSKASKETKKASASKTSQTTKISEITVSENSDSFTFPADINKVTAEQLIMIDGVGEVTAEKIISYRNSAGVINNIRQLIEIDGIGESTVQKLSEYLYVSQNDYRDYNETENEVTQLQNEEEYESNHETSSASVQIQTQISEAEPQLKNVNINKASAEEISECLLIDIELAEKIVDLREQIQYFSDCRELLYVDGLSEQMLAERMDYISV